MMDGETPMRITRLYTREGQDPFAGFKFTPRTSRIVNPNGSVVFEMKDVLVPEGWSQVAVDILAQKYFRKAGVPTRLRTRRRRRRARVAAAQRAGRRRSDARRRDRLAARSSAGSPAAGPTGAGRAATSRPRPTRRRSSTKSATCSPRRWPRRTARSGSTPACTGPTASKGRRRGTTSSIRTTGEMTRSTSAYERPAPHACFIQSVNDDLVNEGGIMDLWVREARIFKYGSGTGSNFSALRGEGEPLSGGGKSCGPDELPQDRRPRRRRDQVRRHHAPRRQDGRPRSRSPGHRGVHQLEGDRGAEGRRPGHRLASC